MSFAISGSGRVGNAEGLRAEGKVPGIIYGAGITPVQFSVSSVELEKLYRNASESTLIDFSFENAAPVKVLLQDVQVDSLKGKITHVDFRQINMNEELEVEVEINLVGLAPAVKELGGSLIQQLESVLVKCLPKDLISSLDVDVSTLATFDDMISIKDLNLPSGVEALNEPDALVAKVEAPMSEEEMKALEEGGAAPVDLSKIEVSEKKGKKEDETAEGEAQPEAPKE